MLTSNFNSKSSWDYRKNQPDDEDDCEYFRRLRAEYDLQTRQIGLAFISA